MSTYNTYGSLIQGRKVLHFIDNTVALSALVHGYSGKPELAKMVNIFYLQMIGLRASVFFDYVPSKANIADLPSRGEHRPPPARAPWSIHPRRLPRPPRGPVHRRVVLRPLRMDSPPYPQVLNPPPRLRLRPSPSPSSFLTLVSRHRAALVALAPLAVRCRAGAYARVE